jgi:group I intron endonuclease
MTHPLDTVVTGISLSAPLSESTDPRTGVYAIWMAGDPRGFTYVGQAGRGVANRLSHHRVSLRQGKHHTAHLQRAYNKYGEDAFVWALVEEVPADVDALTVAEQWWMDCVGLDLLFNTAPAAGSNLGMKKSPEAVAKNKAAHARRTPEERSDIMRRAKASMTPEARVAAIHLGRSRMSEESKAAMAEKRNATVAAKDGGWNAIVLAREAAKTPEQRRASALKREATVTPEEYKLRTARAWETRRANLAKKTVDERDAVLAAHSVAMRAGWAAKKLAASQS